MSSFPAGSVIDGNIRRSSSAPGKHSTAALESDQQTDGKTFSNSDTNSFILRLME